MTDTTTPPKTLALDVEKYQHMLDNEDLTETEKQALLGMLWNVVCEFVMLGFHVHPLQQISGDKTADSSAFTGIITPDMLSCLDFENTSPPITKGHNP